MYPPRFRSLGFALILVALAGLADGQQGGPRWEVLNRDVTGGFIVALAHDLSGNIWVGTEDKGVFRYDPKANQWTQFNSKNGLADDNAYAIACDKLGRVWVGTLNKGVSIFNGEKWQNYDVLDGPIGERIFAITQCPTDCDVWMATSAGLTRYSLKTESWSYYTRADGLPEDQANAIAFDPQGNIYVGTQCHGIAMAKAADDYKKWTTMPGPGVQLPLTPNGVGLPTSLINALLVSREGTVFAGTSAGLAWSKDKGKTWNYLRGRDYAAKVKGRWGGAPAGWQEAPKQVMDTLLPEDYVTSLAEDDGGLLWLGFRQQGYVAIDPKTSKHVFEGNKKADGLADDYVFAILPSADNRPWLGTYGGGVARAKAAMKGPTAKGAATAGKPSEKPAPLPKVAKPPTLAELNGMLDELAKVPTPKPTGSIVRELTDDWRTQGTYVDRYGRFAGTLCAMGGGGNDLGTGYMGSFYGRRGWIGRNCTKGDRLRHWVHWIETDNPRSLQNPLDGGRKQAEWDDHGEAYPMTLAGPHVYGSLTVPPGEYYLSAYFFNKDGHDGSNRYRDYLVEMRPMPINAKVYFNLGAAGIDAEDGFERATIRSQGRISTFWGGCWKRYYVRVPDENTYITVRVNRNYSFNTIVSSLFLDPVGELCGFGGPADEPAAKRGTRFGEEQTLPTKPDDAALRLMDRMLVLRDANPEWYTRQSQRYLLLLVRLLLRKDAAGDCLAGRLEKQSGYRDFRPDVARCLNDVQLFGKRDKVYFSEANYLSFGWQGRTAAGGSENWNWNNQEYRKFIEKQQAAHTWPE